MQSSAASRESWSRWSSGLTIRNESGKPSKRRVRAQQLFDNLVANLDETGQVESTHPRADLVHDPCLDDAPSFIQRERRRLILPRSCEPRLTLPAIPD